MPLYRVHLDDVADGRLRRAAAELGRSVEDLIECTAEEAALEYAKARGWPLAAPYECPVCGVADKTAHLRCSRPDCLDGRDQ